MGRIGKRVYQVVFDCKTGNITRAVPAYGEEYRGKPLTGWKFGILHEEGAYPGPKLRRIDKDGNTVGI